MTFPRYPDYKESGFNWIGEVPAHWKAVPIKRLFAIFGGSTPKSDDAQYWDGDIIWVTPADLSSLASFSVTDSKRCITALGLSSCAANLVPPGSIVLSTRAPIGSLGIAEVPLTTNQGCKSLVPAPGVNGRFYAYLLSIATEQLNTLGKGTTFLELSADALAGFSVPAPPPIEQSAIAAFLDRETAKIDALVAEQERLIELLKEKRQAVISHAVTKGLDPNVRMKDSGVEWLGEVPEHWEIKRLKHVSPEITVGVVIEPSKYYVDSGIPALRSLNVKPGSIDMENVVFFSEESNDVLKKSKLRGGDIVAVRSGQPGTAAVVPPELDGSNCIDLIIIRRPNEGSEHYLCWYLASDGALRQFSEGSGGAIQLHFNIGTAADLLITVPPPSEQTAIAKYIHQKADAFDALVGKAEAAIMLLKERRSALISAAVTGKIDVRGLVQVEEAV